VLGRLGGFVPPPFNLHECTLDRLGHLVKTLAKVPHFVLCRNLNPSIVVPTRKRARRRGKFPHWPGNTFRNRKDHERANQEDEDSHGEKSLAAETDAFLDLV
jgi:hypothetical protein